MKLYIGIDPGKSGGIAVLRADGSVRGVSKMPTSEADLLDTLSAFKVSGNTEAVACIERVSASPQMGVVSAFTFGKGYGSLLMALTAAAIPFDEVVPRKWQAAMQCLSGGDKNLTKRRAQQLFPGIKTTHAISDALLIAEYCRRWRQGLLVGKVTAHGEESSQEGQGDEAKGQVFHAGRRGGKTSGHAEA